MDYNLWIAQDNIRRYLEILGQKLDLDMAARAKLQGLIMAEEEKVAHLCRDAVEMCDRTVEGKQPAPSEPPEASPEPPVAQRS